MRYKIFGNINRNFIEIVFDPTSWLIGFGWFYKPQWIKSLTFHLNFGPLIIIYGSRLTSPR